MKNVNLGIIVSLFLLVALQSGAQVIDVHSQKDPDTDFSRFRTYSWASQIEDVLDEDRFFLNDLVFKADTRDAVRRELESRGYRVDRNKPDLIVNFRVYDRKATLKGYQGYGSRYWHMDEYNPARDIKSVEVEAGTLIISLLDRARGVVVWQAYASGLGNAGAFEKEEGKIREAVNLIFEDFGIRVNEYTRR